MFVSNVFNVVSVLRTQGPQVLSWRWNRTQPSERPGLLPSCHMAPTPEVVTHCSPHPQDILRYTVSSTLLLRLVSIHGGEAEEGRDPCESSTEVLAFVNLLSPGAHIHGEREP